MCKTLQTPSVTVKVNDVANLWVFYGDWNGQKRSLHFRSMRNPFSSHRSPRRRNSAVATAPSVETQRRMYELMTLMKTVDDRMVKGITNGEFITFYYSYRGQEAIGPTSVF